MGTSHKPGGSVQRRMAGPIPSHNAVAQDGKNLTRCSVPLVLETLYLTALIRIIFAIHITNLLVHMIRVPSFKTPLSFELKLLCILSFVFKIDYPCEAFLVKIIMIE